MAPDSWVLTETPTPILMLKEVIAPVSPPGALHRLVDVERALRRLHARRRLVEELGLRVLGLVRRVEVGRALLHRAQRVVRARGERRR